MIHILFKDLDFFILHANSLTGFFQINLTSPSFLILTNTLSYHISGRDLTRLLGDCFYEVTEAL